MSDLVAICEVPIVAGREDEAHAALRALCEATHADDEGCLRYALHTVPGDPTRVILIERWTSAEALESHTTKPHVAAALAVTAFAGPPTVTVLDPAGYGDPSKGEI